jgi:SAM-dependent methyltransferase
MNRATQEMIRALPFTGFDAVEVSGSLWSQFGFKTYRQLWYPEHDICDSPPPVSQFDLVIAEQVLEHALWPYRAARNVFAMLRPGGYVLVTTPFLVRIHNNPVDCSRWSETGLKYLLAEVGFPLERIRTGSWGNRRCVKANLNNRGEWIAYCAWRHSLRNEPEFPVHVWALARKPTTT